MTTFRASLSTRRATAALVMAAGAMTAMPLAVAGPLVAPAAAQVAENPAPPTATTSAAAQVGRTAATLAAGIDAGGAETTVTFEYGTSTGYGLTTPSVTVAAGESAAAVTQLIEGLTPATRYHFRAVATNAAGTVRSADRSFTTASNPVAPSVSTRAVTDLTGTSATLVGRVNPQRQATSYYFEYGTSTKYGSRTPTQEAAAGASTITVTAPIGGLRANTKHYFRLVATNAAGTRRTSSRSFTTTRGLSGVDAGAATRRVTWNTGTTITGSLSGLSAGGAKVALMRMDHPFTGAWRQVATATANSSGVYSFATGPLYEAVRFQVVSTGAGRVASPWVIVQSKLWSRLKIKNRRAGTYRLSGRVLPVVANGTATLQRRTPKGRWITVKRLPLKHDTARNRSTYAVSAQRLASRSARYRVRVVPRDAGAHITTNAHSVLVKKRR